MNVFHKKDMEVKQRGCTPKRILKAYVHFNIEEGKIFRENKSPAII